MTDRAGFRLVPTSCGRLGSGFARDLDIPLTDGLVGIADEDTE
ncbi:hypothetical protein [Plantactinospora alkalitolerans]|nr:hypothetical protein [Plantactinospora alkalitolerans]